MSMAAPTLVVKALFGRTYLTTSESSCGSYTDSSSSGYSTSNSMIKTHRRERETRYASSSSRWLSEGDCHDKEHSCDEEESSRSFTPTKVTEAEGIRNAAELVMAYDCDDDEEEESSILDIDEAISAIAISNESQSRETPRKDHAEMVHYFDEVFQQVHAQQRINNNRINRRNSLFVEEPGRVGSYKLLNKLGEGGYAEVWRAHLAATPYDHREKHSRQYAIKKFSKTRYATTAHHVRQLMVELNLMVQRRTHHPNLATAVEVLHGKEHLYAVMELAAMDLVSFESRCGCLFQPCIKRIMAGMIRGLNHLHSHGVAHLDIKPLNVLITRNHKEQSQLSINDVQLCDFGLAARAKSGQKTVYSNGFNGTAGFMAPEIHLVGLGPEKKKKHQNYDCCKADMWSVGVILMWVSGYLHPDWSRLFANLKLDGKLFLRELDDIVEEMDEGVCLDGKGELSGFLMKLLALDPDERLTAIEALESSYLASCIDPGHVACDIGSFLSFFQD